MKCCCAHGIVKHCNQTMNLVLARISENTRLLHLATAQKLRLASPNAVREAKQICARPTKLAPLALKVFAVVHIVWSEFKDVTVILCQLTHLKSGLQSRKRTFRPRLGAMVGAQVQIEGPDALLSEMKKNYFAGSVARQASGAQTPPPDP